MSRKIIGVTVGTTLPKPNFKQTDPTKGDYIKNKPDFDGLKTKVNNMAADVEGLMTKVGDTSVLEQIFKILAAIEYTNATDDGTGIVTLGTFIKPIFPFGADATISDQVLSVSGTGFNTDIQNNVLFVSGSNANAVLENGVCIVRN